MMTAGWHISLLLALAAGTPEFHVYVGDVTENSAVIAWGTTSGAGNTIGRASAPHGEAAVTLGGRETAVRDRNWIRVEGLEAGREYPYEVALGGKRIGQGTIRTHPLKVDRLTFFVIGDFGTGRRGQTELAEVMTREFLRLGESRNPVRFVLSTGDNIYGRWGTFVDTGDRDARWGKTFFEPYAGILRHAPFYAVLGNHDGNSSESRGDLAVCLDNFFFPGGEPARWYRFSYGGLADFFALDTTVNTETGPERPACAAGGEQIRWFERELAKSTALWKVVWFHYPPFSAGPRHRGSLEDLRHLHDLLVKHRVQVVFNGHEHNFQFTDPGQTGGVQYVVTGSGGQLRRGRVAPAAMRAEKIAGWAPQRQFCRVEIVGDRMTITPIGVSPMNVIGPDGCPAAMPIVIERR
jgi:predicted MPP superfamily phosphohydrolase